MTSVQWVYKMYECGKIITYVKIVLIRGDF